ncbi:MAG: DNA polymerase III subunit [Deltaproteobacteria bacterium]|nr:DNA polymerase III subunit [Deltaproteobacteria bacterium]
MTPVNMLQNILGHERELAQIQRALAGEKIPHAYLFCGMEGIGKCRIAYALAEALDCKSDLRLIEPLGTTIKIEVIRELKSSAYLHPLEGSSKVVLVNDAHALTDAAANSLLKILEEPPSQTYFILITSRPLKLLPTIRSRCQRIEFSPLTEAEIEKKLVRDGLPPEEAKQRAKLGEGSLKQAMEMDIAFIGQVETELEKLGFRPPPSQIFKTAENWVDDEEKIPRLFGILNHLWHQKIMARQSGPRPETLKQWEAIQSAQRGFESYANKQLLMENLLFQLTS